MNWLFLITINLFLSSSCAYFIAKYGHRLKLIDYPNIRSSHFIPIPKGGAIGILVAFILTAIILDTPLYLWGTITFFSLLGFFADRFSLTVQFRLFSQLACAFIFLLGITKPPFNIYEMAYGILFLIFILGTTNIYNFMDGINGIAAITGIVGFGLLAFFAYQQEISNTTVILSLCIVSACVGFLPFNIPGAKVFMGDVGSTFLGSVFACLAIIISKNIFDFICIASFLFTFYIDEIITMHIRLNNKENLLHAHRKHFYQFLANNLNIAHWKISVAYGITQGIIGTMMILLRPLGIIVVTSTLLVLFITVAFLVFLTYNKYSLVEVKSS